MPAGAEPVDRIVVGVSGSSAPQLGRAVRGALRTVPVPDTLHHRWQGMPAPDGLRRDDDAARWAGPARPAHRGAGEETPQ